MDILEAVLAAKLAGDGGGEGSGDAKKEAAKALAEAKSYADTKKAEANSYTDTKTTDTLTAAKNYTNDRIEELDVQFVAATGTIGTMTLGTGWSGIAPGPYTISVTISGYTITENTMVSVLPDATAITQMKSDQTEKIYVKNDNGSLTAYAIGGIPTAALTFPVLFTEVE